MKNKQQIIEMHKNIAKEYEDVCMERTIEPDYIRYRKENYLKGMLDAIEIIYNDENEDSNVTIIKDKNKFYESLKEIGFERITTCEREETDYFFIDLPRVRVVFTKWNDKEYALCVRNVKDDNFCNNLPLKTFNFLEEKTINFIRKFVEFLGE